MNRLLGQVQWLSLDRGEDNISGLPSPALEGILMGRREAFRESSPRTTLKDSTMFLRKDSSLLRFLNSEDWINPGFDFVPEMIGLVGGA
jgi:hypothetical protein